MPGIFVNRRKSQGTTLASVDSPANLCRFDQLINIFEHLLFDTETITDLGTFEISQYFRARKATAGQPQQLQKYSDQRVTIADADIGNIPGQSGAFTAGIVLENSLDVGCISADFGHHNQNVFARQFGMSIEQAEQVIVQYLTFSHRAVTNVDADRIVDKCPRRRRFKLEQAALQGLQNTGIAGRMIGFDFGSRDRAKIEQQILHRLTLPAPRGQQAVTGIGVLDLVRIL